MKSFLVDQDGYYGEFGGAYVPEILHKCVEELTNKYLEVIESEEFKKEFEQLLRDYVGRPSPLYLAKRLSEKYGCKLYLKREDLNHTGAHKINNTIGQILLARRMGKKRIIAETGAGQHASHYGKPYLAIAHIARCFNARYTYHALIHPRILDLAQKLAHNELNIIVCSC